jgi:hypothetical protein
MSTPISFGLSSGFFYVAWLYAFSTTNCTMWTITLFILPVSSYYCNTTLSNPLYYKWDQSVIIALSCIYLSYHDMTYVSLFIGIWYAIELYYTDKLTYVVMIAFVLQIIYACTLFGTIELFLCACCVLTSSYCYYKRDPMQYSYLYYTTWWHIACTMMLLLGTRTLIMIPSI